MNFDTLLYFYVFGDVYLIWIKLKFNPLSNVYIYMMNSLIIFTNSYNVVHFFLIIFFSRHLFNCFSYIIIYIYFPRAMLWRNVTAPTLLNNLTSKAWRSSWNGKLLLKFSIFTRTKISYWSMNKGHRSNNIKLNKWCMYKFNLKWMFWPMKVSIWVLVTTFVIIHCTEICAYRQRLFSVE